MLNFKWILCVAFYFIHIQLLTLIYQSVFYESVYFLFLIVFRRHKNVTY